MIELRVRLKEEVFTVLLDDEDKDLRFHVWSAVRQKPRVYFRRTTSKDPQVQEYLHRVILSRKLGRDLVPGEQSDHKDRNFLNNCRSNIRLATHAQNMANTTGYRGHKFHGVTKQRNRYISRITNGNVMEGLGTYDTPEEAHEVFKRRHVQIHGEFSPYYEENRDGQTDAR